MTREQAEMLQEMHDFWYKPATLDQPTRAQQLDRVLALTRGTTFAGKALMMLAGVIVTVASVWATVKAAAGVT